MKNIVFASVLFFILLSCKKTVTTNQPPSNAAITGLNCNGASANAATVGMPFSSTLTLPYTGGNNVAYNSGTPVTSSGVIGLVATLQSGVLATGAGNFTYTISGTPATNGVATFDISFRGISCRVSIQVNEAPLVQYGTPFNGVVDRQDATIYQVNMRPFSNQGNFQGVIARLDSIKALGANVVYLMPIHPVGTVLSVNSPYAVKDYKAVNTEFGTLADLRALVDGAHSKNMSVILDWVANHTAWDNPWITSHRDWYLQDGGGSIVSPPGMGWNDVAQLNFNNSAMRQEMIKNLKYWVYTANIDGFRFDYADGPPLDFWKQAIDTLRSITTHKILLLAEGNRSNHYTAGFDFTFGFSFFGQLKNIMNNNQAVTLIDGLNNSEYVSASNGQQVVRYLTNHDVNGSDGTPLDLFGGVNGSMAAFVVAAYMKSVPMIYNGQEVGFPTRITFPFTGTKINWNINPTITAEYKNVIALRNSSAAIRRGSLSSFSNADICAFTKELGAERIFVAANLRNTPITYTLPPSVANSTWLNAFTGSTTTLATQLILQPYSYVVLKK